MPEEIIAEGDRYILRLYVAGSTPRSILAESRLRELCEEHLPGRYHIEVIDLLARPDLAREDQILAVPTLVRELPVPIRKFIGDLAHPERILVDFKLLSGDVDPFVGPKGETDV